MTTELRFSSSIPANNVMSLLLLLLPALLPTNTASNVTHHLASQMTSQTASQMTSQTASQMTRQMTSQTASQMARQMTGLTASQRAPNPLCEPLDVLQPAPVTWGHSVPVGSLPGSMVTPKLNCSDQRRLVALEVRAHPGGHGATVRIFLCPSVRVLRLQLLADEDRFLQVPVTVTLTSCAHLNDTLLVRKGRHRLHVTLQVVKEYRNTSQDWARYSYSVHPEGGTQHRHYQADEKLDDKAPNIPSSPPSSGRWKRSPMSRDPRPVATPTHNSDILQGPAAVRSTQDCGVTRTCIRYGREGCGHLSCDYMLSYLVNSTDVDLQMSARGTGWVAVGFSSDKFMGGGDDVIVCKRERKTSSRVLSMSLGNTVKHTRPQEKTNRLTFLEGLLEDNHIYCRITRPLEFPKRLADSDLDLVNDWHQLYAYGDIDGNGRILQHTKKPRVSEKKITMVRIKNIMVTTSTASLPLEPLRITSLTLLSLTFAFVGS